MNPIAGAGAGTVTFRLYSDNACANQIFVSSNRPLNLTTPTSGTATSETFAPANTGQYFWRAFYSGDTNNLPVSGACGAAGETSTVTPAQPTVNTQATNGTLGGTIGDTATVSGLVNPVTTGAGAGTVTFRLYSDAACANQVFVSADRPINMTSATSGTATSATFTPTSAGTYFWRAFYSGDANNAAVSHPCGAPNETSTVARAQPAISTQASPTITLGEGTLTDLATVTGLVNPVTGAGAGTVTFRLYGPNDATCATCLLYTSDAADE